MDVMNVEQAKIAEEAGASAVMALGESESYRQFTITDLDRGGSERIPANIRRDGGVARMVRRFSAKIGVFLADGEGDS